MIDRRTIELIMDTAKVEEVVGDFVALRKRGVNMIGLCPFHNEKTPSFTVSPAKNLWKCFGCGKGGKPVHFIMEHEQLSYYDALRWLAKRYHIEIKDKTYPRMDTSALAHDSTLRGEIYRTLLPQLECDDPEKRREATMALRVALLAVDGRDISL